MKLEEAVALLMVILEKEVTIIRSLEEQDLL